MPPRSPIAHHGDEQRQIAEVTARLRASHPELPERTVVELVEQAFADLRHARVRSFDAILAERAVRRQLRTVKAPDRPEQIAS